jgi:hypothetical protein
MSSNKSLFDRHINRCYIHLRYFQKRILRLLREGFRKNPGSVVVK